MSIIDLIPKCISNQFGCNMTLYCNMKMNLTYFEYEDNTYIIDDYDMNEDCFVIKCNKIIFKIPVNLTLCRDTDIIIKSNNNIKEDIINLDVENLDSVKLDSVKLDSVKLDSVKSDID